MTAYAEATYVTETNEMWIVGPDAGTVLFKIQEVNGDYQDWSLTPDEAEQLGLSLMKYARAAKPRKRYRMA